MFAIRKNFLYKNIIAPRPRQAGCRWRGLGRPRLDNHEHAGVSETGRASSVTQAPPRPTQARASSTLEEPLLRRSWSQESCWSWQSDCSAQVVGGVRDVSAPLPSPPAVSAQQKAVEQHLRERYDDGDAIALVDCGGRPAVPRVSRGHVFRRSGALLRGRRETRARRMAVDLLSRRYSIRARRRRRRSSPIFARLSSERRSLDPRGCASARPSSKPGATIEQPKRGGKPGILPVESDSTVVTSSRDGDSSLGVRVARPCASRARSWRVRFGATDARAGTAATTPQFGSALRLLAESYRKLGREAEAERFVYRAGRVPPYSPYADPVIDELARESRNSILLAAARVRSEPGDQRGVE